MHVGSQAVFPHNVQKSDVMFSQSEESPCTTDSISHPWECQDSVSVCKHPSPSRCDLNLTSENLTEMGVEVINSVSESEPRLA